MPSFSPVTHILFDLDGLLLDTEILYTKAIQNIASEFGKEYPWEVKVKCMGKKLELAAQIIIDDLDLPLTLDQYVEKFMKEQSNVMPTATFLPASVPTYLLCNNRVLLKYGYSLGFNEVMCLMGLTAFESAKQVCTQFNLPLTPKEYKSMVSSFYPEIFPNIQLTEGAERLVRHLHQHKIPIAIASGCAKESFDLKSTNHKEFFKLFDHFVFASSDPEVKAGKPNPDIFTVCANRFSEKPNMNKCLVFEDAPNGVAAALAADMQVVMVPDVRLDRKLTQDATLVLNSLEDFKPELFGLPPF